MCFFVFCRRVESILLLEELFRSEKRWNGMIARDKISVFFLLPNMCSSLQAFRYRQRPFLQDLPRFSVVVDSQARGQVNER